MRGMQRVAQQHAVMSAPAIVMHYRKLPPHRVVRDQCVPIQGAGKYTLAEFSCLRVGHLREAGARECGLINLDNEGATAWFIAVVVGIEKSEVSLDEGLS